MNQAQSKILLVDDRASNILALEGILSTLPATIISAESGQEGLAKTMEHDFALVLLDVQMPELDGFETAQLIRGVKKSQHLPIIFVTALNTDQQFVFKGYELGAVDYLSKPINPDILRSKVKVFLELDRQQKALVSEVAARRRAEEKLRAYAADLQNSNNALQEFSSLVAHDLQEPLSLVEGFALLLQKKYGLTFDTKSSQFLEQIVSSTQRMQNLVKDLLSYAQVVTKEPTFTKVDLNRVIKDVLTDLHIRVEQTKGQVEIERLPVIEANPVLMHQLFQNLIANALKFRHKNTRPQVTVSAQKSTGSDFEAWDIAVADNGIGFEEKHFAAIFNPFSRLHNKNEYDGSGLGLAMCYKVCEHHHGNLKAKSSPGKGSVFIATLPVFQLERKKEPTY